MMHSSGWVMLFVRWNELWIIHDLDELLAVKLVVVVVGWVLLACWPSVVGENHEGRSFLLFVGILLFFSVGAVVVAIVLWSVSWVTFLKGFSVVVESIFVGCGWPVQCLEFLYKFSGNV